MFAYDLEDWQTVFDEEAGRLEYDEGLRRLQAEALARQYVIVLRGNADNLKTAIPVFQPIRTHERKTQ